jgi:hypothetical protein
LYSSKDGGAGLENEPKGWGHSNHQHGECSGNECCSAIQRGISIVAGTVVEIVFYYRREPGQRLGTGPVYLLQVVVNQNFAIVVPIRIFCLLVVFAFP